MSAFHEQVLGDMPDEFLDPDVFGELHHVDGEPMYCVLDEDERVQDPNSAAFGIYDCDLVLYARASDIARGREGEKLDLDGILYTITAWRTDMGMHRVALTAPMSH